MTKALEIADGVFTVVPSQFGSSNSGFVIDDEQVTVIDTRMAPLLADEMLHLIRDVTPLPVTRVVNTHFHGDHVFGNQVFSPPARVISHRLAREELEERGRAVIEEFIEHYNIAERYTADVVESLWNTSLILADEVFDERLVLPGGREIELEYVGPAHTRGDITAHVTDVKAIFVGDMVFNGVHPFWLDGFLDGTIEGLRTIDSMDIDVVVPGHGDVADARAVTAMLEYFEEIKRVIVDVKTNGGVAGDATRKLEASLGDYGTQPHRIESTVGRFWDQVQLEGAK